MFLTLAASDLFNQIAPWLGGLVVVAVIGGLIMVAARRNATNKSADTPSIGFTLADLRRLKENGEMDQSQYERAKASLMKSPEMAGHLSAISQTQSTMKVPRKKPFQSPPTPGK